MTAASEFDNETKRACRRRSKKSIRYISRDRNHENFKNYCEYDARLGSTHHLFGPSCSRTIIEGTQSFNDHYNAQGQQQQCDEPRSLRRDQTTNLISVDKVQSSFGVSCPNFEKSKRKELYHSDACTECHHGQINNQANRNKLAQLKGVPRIHNGHKKSLLDGCRPYRRSRSSPVGNHLLLLLATSCLCLMMAPSLLVSPSEAAHSRTTDQANGGANEASSEEDFYSSTPTLSQQKQGVEIPHSAIQKNKNSTMSDSNNNSKNVQLDEVSGRTVTAKRAARSGPVPISEFELLPFSDFIIRPPVFNDLMKSWPPTTLRAVASSLAAAADSLTNRQKLQQGQSTGPPDLMKKDHLQQRQQQQQHYHHQSQQRWNHEGQQDLQSLLMRNHLNEDLDDTIVTADQSFERSQTPEPETWINYLGDLGDYIYLQLKHYLEKTAPASSANRLASGSNKFPGESNNMAESSDSNLATAAAAATAAGGQQQPQKRSPLKMETIDELLDDYYYDQYENSQVLYYGAQLVREHDSFEIGCFLPIDQQAEWTKSGRPLPPDGQGSPRTISRSSFLNAKQNYTLKVFTASMVSIAC